MNTKIWPQEIVKLQPEIAIVLGSGLAGLVDHMEVLYQLPFNHVPGLKTSTAPGHEGVFIVGKLNGVTVLCQKGRLHYYEGYSMEEITYPIQLIHELGIKKLILSNAAGAINMNFHVGELMLIKDHINFMGDNPLIGPRKEGFDRFPDMTFAYSPVLRNSLKETANELQIPIQEGVYIATTGPSYETPAEIRAFRLLGADAVGMSTVPEVIVANYLGMEVLGISCLSNMAAGILEQKLSEKEVLDAGKQVENTLVRLVAEFVAKIG